MTSLVAVNTLDMDRFALFCNFWVHFWAFWVLLHASVELIRENECDFRNRVIMRFTYCQIFTCNFALLLAGSAESFLFLVDFLAFFPSIYDWHFHPKGWKNLQSLSCRGLFLVVVHEAKKWLYCTPYKAIKSMNSISEIQNSRFQRFSEYLNIILAILKRPLKWPFNVFRIFGY